VQRGAPPILVSEVRLAITELLAKEYHVHTELARAWGDWLSTFEWDWWCTLTFREPYSARASTRAFQRWAACLPTSDSSASGVRYFMAHEIGRLGRLHLHALLGDVHPGTLRKNAWRIWFDRHGRAQILPYESELGAGHYISKYVTKDLAHYEIN